MQKVANSQLVDEKALSLVELNLPVLESRHQPQGQASSC